MAWYLDWTYRKTFSFNNASADYQTKILVGESAGAVGEEVDCNSNCLTTFNDLRFTGADGSTLIDYFIESISGATPNQLATIWVQNTAAGDATGCMYYGKAGAAAVSNGTNTFIVFDDFERGVDGDTVGGSWTEVTAHIHISTEKEYTGIAANTRSMKLIGGAGNPTLLLQ